jgi:hypothetical protein
MPARVKPITLWRKEIDNQPGVSPERWSLSRTGGADLQVVMGYRYPGNEAKAVIELYPVAGKKLVKAAQVAGLTASPIPTLLVEGDNKAGLGHAVARAIAESGVNLAFMVTQVIGRRYSRYWYSPSGRSGPLSAAGHCWGKPSWSDPKRVLNLIGRNSGTCWDTSTID